MEYERLKKMHKGGAKPKTMTRKVSRKGQGAVIGALVIAVSLIVGLLVFGTVKGSFNVDDWPDQYEYNTGANDTGTWYENRSTILETVTNNSNSGFSIGSILPIVIFAGAIMGSLAFAKFR
jgi:hypothetical protein